MLAHSCDVIDSQGLCSVQDVAKFFMLSGLVQLMIYVALIPSFVQAHASVKSTLLQLMLSVLGAIEPLLPAIVVFVRVVGLLRLRRQGIIVSDTQKMLTAGHLDVVLFDKTGTLTAEQVKLRLLTVLHTRHSSGASPPWCAAAGYAMLYVGLSSAMLHVGLHYHISGYANLTKQPQHILPSMLCLAWQGTMIQFPSLHCYSVQQERVRTLSKHKR